jgi:hypothetical protein
MNRVLVLVLVAVVVLVFAAYTVEVRRANLAPVEYKVIRVCDRVTWKVPAEDARQIKRGAEKDYGIFPAKPHPAKHGKYGGIEI